MTSGVTIERRVEWPDTDAAGHYHHSAIIRWVESAEAELLDRIGLLDLFGSVPRVHYEVDYLDRLWFRDRVQIELRVADVGTSSLRYEFEVRRDDRPAVRGSLVCVNADPKGAGPQPWTETVRTTLLGDGEEKSAESPVEQLRRWEVSGGVWEIAARRGSKLTIALLRCDGGEEVGRVTSGDPELAAYVGDRSSGGGSE